MTAAWLVGSVWSLFVVVAVATAMGNVVVAALGWSGASDLPSTEGTTHFLLSGPKTMLSGQAQVNFADRWLIRGAGRQRNSQPPFMLLLSLHQFVPDKANIGYRYVVLAVVIKKTCGEVFLPVGCLRSWYSMMSSG